MPVAFVGTNHVIATLGLIILWQASSVIGQHGLQQLPAVPPHLTGTSGVGTVVPAPGDVLPAKTGCPTISALDLTVAYANDAAAARLRYSGRPLLLEGKVWGRSQENDQLTYVTLVGHPRKTYDVNEQSCWLICLLGKENQAFVNTLQNGDTVSVLGRCNGDILDGAGVRLIFFAQHISKAK